MTYLPSLIKKINDFSHQASKLSLLKKVGQNKYEEYDDVEEPEIDYSQYTDPRFQGGQGKPIEEVEPLTEEDEPETGGPEVGANEDAQLLIDIKYTANEFTNSDIAMQLKAAAADYETALTTPGLFDRVLRTIRNARVGIYDAKQNEADTEEIEATEDFLNQMENNIKDRMKVTPTQQVDKDTADRAFRAGRQKFLKEEEDLKEIGVSPEAMPQKFERGKPGENPGIGPGGRAFATLTADKCENEIKTLMGSLQDTRSARYQDKIEELIKAIQDVLSKMKLNSQAQEHLAGLPDDPERKNLATIAKNNLDRAKAKRAKLKIDLRSFQQTLALEDLNKQRESARSPEEKKWLGLRIRLQEIRLLTTYHKTPVVKILKKLIKATGMIDSHGDYQSQKIDPEEIKKLEIQFETAYKEMQTKAEYDRKATEERGQLQGRDIVPEMPAQRGGWRPPVRKDFSQFNYAALAKEFRDQKNSAISEIKKLVVAADIGSAKTEHPFLKQLIDNVSEAYRKKNVMEPHPKGTTRVNPEFNEALNVLRQKTAEQIRRIPFFKSYEQCLKILRIMNHIDARAFEIIPWTDGEGTWELDPGKLDTIKNLIINIRRLQKMYSFYFETPGTSKYKANIINYFTKPIDFLDEIATRLEFEALKPYNETSQKEMPKRQQELGLAPEPGQKRKNKKRAEQRMDFFTKLSAEPKKYPSWDPAVKKIYDRKIIEERARQQGRDVPPMMASQIGGWRPLDNKLDNKDDYIHKVATFAGVIHLLEEKINTAISETKKKVFKENLELKPYVDAVTTAIAKKNKEAYFEAMRQLKEQKNKFSINDRNLQRLEKSVRLVPHLKKLRDDLREIEVWHNEDGTWETNPVMLSNIPSLIDRSERLANIIKTYYGKSGKLDIYFDKSLNTLSNIIERLKNVTNQGVV